MFLVSLAERLMLFAEADAICYTTSQQSVQVPSINATLCCSCNFFLEPIILFAMRPCEHPVVS